MLKWQKDKRFIFCSDSYPSPSVVTESSTGDVTIIMIMGYLYCTAQVGVYIVIFTLYCYSSIYYTVIDLFGVQC